MKNFFKKKIEFEYDETSNGVAYGLMAGSVLGMILSVGFEIELGFMYGMLPALVLGLGYDIYSAKKKKKKKVRKITKKKTKKK